MTESITKAEMIRSIRDHLPQLLRSDPSLGDYILSVTCEHFYPKAEPERRHFSRNPKWGPSDFGCEKSGDGHCLRRPAFVLRPSRRALRAAPGFPQ